jgi:hypothetical protein
MSQLADITKTFRKFSEKYNWSKEETAENMLDILSDCEWGLPINDIKDEKGNIDYEATAIAEEKFVYKLLWD